MRQNTTLLDYTSFEICYLRRNGLVISVGYLYWVDNFRSIQCGSWYTEVFDTADLQEANELLEELVDS